MSIGGRLKFARERSGLTGTQVKDRTGIGESSLSEFENGKREPSISQIQALAKVYRSSIAFLLGGGAIRREVVLWRKKPEQDSGDLETRFLRLCEQYHNLEVWTEAKRAPQMPDAQGEPKTFGYSDAESLAKQVRDALVMGDHPGKVLLSALEEIWNVKVFHLDFQPTGAAASTVSEIFGPAILLNANDVPWRRNFDLAHELFHLLTFGVFHQETTKVASYPSEREEKLATCFARHLLMPVEATRSAINSRSSKGRISIEALFDVARQFDVSIEALCWHLHFIYGRGPDDTKATEELIEKAKRLAPLFDGRERFSPPKWPSRYHDLAVKALRKGELSIGRFAEYLDIGRQEAMRYMAEENLDGEQVELAST